MAQPVLLRDLLPAALAQLRPVTAARTGRVEQPPIPRRDGLSQLLARVDRLAPRSARAPAAADLAG